MPIYKEISKAGLDWIGHGNSDTFDVGENIKMDRYF